MKPTEEGMKVKVKVFVGEHCPRCKALLPPEEELEKGAEFLSFLLLPPCAEGGGVSAVEIEEIDVESPEGRAEALLSEVTAVPTLVIETEGVGDEDLSAKLPPERLEEIAGKEGLFWEKVGRAVKTMGGR